MKYVIILFCLLFTKQLQAQKFPVRIKQKTQAKAENRVDAKVDNNIDKGLNKTEEAIGSIFKKKNKKSRSDAATDETADADQPNGNTGSRSAKVKTTSDFVPGTKVVFEDHFEKDAMGDFPAKWNSNGSASIVSIDGVEGKWLSVLHNTMVNPELKTALPVNCTIEFDLFLQSENGSSIPYIQFGLTPVKNILKENLYYKEKFFATISRYNEKNGKTIEYGLKETIGNKSDFPLTNYVNRVMHVAMALNGERIRVYYDDKKIIDLPKALTPAMRNNFYINNVYVVPASQLPLLVGNIRIANADADARSLLITQLMDEGKASTSDILFDVNSDVIKASSYGIIDQFGEALNDNPDLKIKIVGHTDSDGADAANLTLSKKRAIAVKNYLVKKFAVSATRLQTDGKGEAEPVDENTSAAGKAKNRRVEFVKL